MRYVIALALALTALAAIGSAVMGWEFNPAQAFRVAKGAVIVVAILLFLAGSTGSGDPPRDEW